MTTTDKPAVSSDRELVLTRIIDAPREKVFRAWTEPDLLKQWFAPAPGTTPIAMPELKIRAARRSISNRKRFLTKASEGVYFN